MDKEINSKSDKQTSMGEGSDRRTFLSGLAWTLPTLYLFSWGVSDAVASPHQDQPPINTHTDGHADLHQEHSDTGHQDGTPGPPQHTDYAHSDVGHADGSIAHKHADVDHHDGGHSDLPTWPDPHNDVRHDDTADHHSDNPNYHSHADIPHGDVPHSDNTA